MNKDQIFSVLQDHATEELIRLLRLHYHNIDYNDQILRLKCKALFVNFQSESLKAEERLKAAL